MPETSTILTKQEVINPFPGLRPFNMDESHLFFGREGQSEEILKSLSKEKFVAVIGASGSGKSSLIYCGLVPILYGGFVGKKTSNWKVVTSRPGNSPIDNLSSSLIKNADIETEESEDLKIKVNSSVLRNSSYGLIDSVNQLYDLEKNNVLIIIDQFEELFKYKYLNKDLGNVNESEAFVKLLISAVNNSELPIYVVITMRSDFIGECSQFQELTDLINDSNYLVPQMTRDDFKQAITGPVAVGGAEMETQLIQQLLNEVGDNPDQLPILQHALMRTWDYWLDHSDQGQAISIADYEAIGRMEKALSEHANEAFDELSEEGKAACESLFKTITEKGNDNRGIRHPTSINKIATIAKVENDLIKEIIEPFRAAGRSFLTPAPHIELTNDSIIDISHESLMRIWNRLKVWVEEESSAVQMYLRLSEASEMYQLGKTGLWRPPDLQLALNWRERQNPTLAWAERYNPAFERAIVYLETSEKEFKAEEENKIKLQKRTLRRTKIFAVVLGSAAVIGIGLTVYSQMMKIKADQATLDAIKQKEIAVEQQNIAEQQTQIAKEKEQEALEQKGIADEQRNIAEERQLEAIKSAEIAEYQRKVALQREQEAERERQKAIENEKEAQRQKDAAEQASDEAFRRRMLSISQSMAVKSQQITDNKQLAGLISYQSYLFNEEFEGAKHNPDVYSGLYYSLKGLEGQSFNTLKGHSGAVRDLTFKPNSNILFSTGGDGKILQWNLKELNADPEVVIENPYANRSIAISPDGKWLACGTDVFTVQLFKLGDNIELVTELTGHTKSVLDVAFSSDSEYVYSLGNDKVLLKWNIESRQNEEILRSDKKLNVMAISIEGDRIALGSEKGELLMVNLNDNKQKIHKLDTRNDITAIDFHMCDKYIGVGDKRGMLTIIDGDSYQKIGSTKGHRSKIYDIEFNNDGDVVATSSLDGTVKIWEVNNLTNQPILLKDHESWVLSIVYSPDGKTLVTSSDKEERILTWYTKNEFLAEKVKERLSRNLSNEEWKTYIASDIDYRKTCSNLE